MDSAQRAERRRVFLSGVRDGVPIGLGYLAVAFSLGIAARNAGLNAFQGFLISLLNNASAGEYAAFTVIAADSGFLEMALITLITNARYLLMSCSLSQKFSPDTPLYHRLLVGYDVTDELLASPSRGPAILTRFIPTARSCPPSPAGPSAQRWASRPGACCPRGWSARFPSRCSACFWQLLSHRRGRTRSCSAA